MTRFIAFLSITLYLSAASAQERDNVPTPPLVPTDPSEKIHAAVSWQRVQQDRPDHATAMVTTTRPLTRFEVARLEHLGARFARRRGDVLRVGRVYGATIPWEVLDEVAASPLVTSIQRAQGPPMRPAEFTVELAGGHAIQHVDTSGDGSGMLVGVLDSGVDVLHPHFFYSDGGAFDWVDVDASGTFDAGVDAVDIDADGEVGETEVLWPLIAAETDSDTEELSYRPGFDWLFVDTNGDGVRNAGDRGGFTESDPAYGEPLFVGDDANRNGVLDPGERVLRLSTSKIRRYVTDDGEFVRGVDLIFAPRPGGEYASHGTQTSSVILGGQWPHLRRGFAPSAELIMYSGYPEPNEFENVAILADALERDVDVVLYELSRLVWTAQDGSDALDVALTEAASEVVQVTAAGNIGGAGKVRHSNADDDGTAEFSFLLGEDLLNPKSYKEVWIHLMTPSPSATPLAMTGPDGTESMFGLLGLGVEHDADHYHYNESWTTERGNLVMAILLWAEDDAEISQGTWTIEVSGLEPGATISGWLQDDRSGWARGVVWVDESSDGTILSPSTADGAFAAAAYGGRRERQGGVGELRNWSAAGPRFGSGATVDIAAPDDAFAADLSGFGGEPWFDDYGGTSGASAHTAGAFALLKSVVGDVEPSELQRLMTDGALQDGFTDSHGPLPNDHWGDGKLDVFSAVYGRPRRALNAPPIPKLKLKDGAFDASESSDPDGDSLSFRWDVGYDGQWDTPWTETAVWAEDATPGEWVVRLQVADSEGASVGTILRTVVTEPEPEMPDEPSAPDDGPEESTAPTDDQEPQPSMGEVAGCCGTVNGHRPGNLVALLMLALWGRRRLRRPDHGSVISASSPF